MKFLRMRYVLRVYFMCLLGYVAADLQSLHGVQALTLSAFIVEHLGFALDIEAITSVGSYLGALLPQQVCGTHMTRACHGVIWF
jgi:hypothetical protein